MDAPSLRLRLLEALFAGTGIRRYRLNARDWAGVRRLREQRYGRWLWNSGNSPLFNTAASRRFPFGEIDARMEVREGRIEQIRLLDDFLATAGARQIERALSGLDWSATSPASLSTRCWR